MSEHDEAAGGLESVAHSLRHAWRAGLSRALPALRLVNQPEGFDCPGCGLTRSSPNCPSFSKGSDRKTT